MAKKLSGAKIAAIILILLVGAVAGFGYVQQSSVLTKDAPKEAPNTELAATESKKITDPTLLAVKPNDIIFGDANALVTIVEYASLSCTHCAHFHEAVLPTLQKEFIATGKVRLVFRHFPLNEPALKATELVECAGQNGLDRSNFLKALFSSQSQWAFDENFVSSLKKIAQVGGIDSATFDSCLADKALDTKIVADRQQVQEKLGVDSTPSFFINGVAFEGDRSPEAFRKAINAATAAKK